MISLHAESSLISAFLCWTSLAPIVPLTGLSPAHLSLVSCWKHQTWSPILGCEGIDLILQAQALCPVCLADCGCQTVLVISVLSLDHFVWNTDFMGPGRNRRPGPGVLTTQTGMRDKATGESHLVSIWHDEGYFGTNAKLQFHPSYRMSKPLFLLRLRLSCSLEGTCLYVNTSQMIGRTEDPLSCFLLTCASIVHSQWACGCECLGVRAFSSIAYWAWLQ